MILLDISGIANFTTKLLSVGEELSTLKTGKLISGINSPNTLPEAEHALTAKSILELFRHTDQFKAKSTLM